ncbi:aminoacyl-tRNA hydrolase [Candidatus Dojkabacteria bacterium]|uniref:Aminoacyl-tRNA hydrolase n=1 Tax=Candidatus Dojkabacteria bacterium TaxID=2099670 RepID=A0A955RLP8_9BACT|nr:aminoacyl-tRNA hydrolase [Candidatus Dojkabacteria bacterium]
MSPYFVDTIYHLRMNLISYGDIIYPLNTNPNMEIEFDMKKIKLIVGLGNLGKNYQKSRHNVGFFLIDRLTNTDLKEDSKFEAFTNSIEIAGNKVTVAKPTTMMNDSGRSVKKIADYFNINPSEILIAHDDLDIALGEYKIQFSKGPKIHNGIISIEQHLGTPDFWRLRIGVDNRTPEQRTHMSGADYVLNPMNSADLETVNKAISTVIEEFEK